MAINIHHRARRRQHRRDRDHWLIVLITRTVASIALMIIAHLFGAPTCSQ
jgi:hypothetical protein